MKKRFIEWRCRFDDIKHYYSQDEGITDSHKEFAQDAAWYDFLNFVATTFTHKNCGLCRCLQAFCTITASIFVFLGAFGFRSALMVFIFWCAVMAYWRMWIRDKAGAE